MDTPGSISPDRREEFEKVAMPHLRNLLSTALRFTCNSHDAEDLVQETYYQAWKAFHQFQPETHAKAWLFKILLRLIFKRHRKAKKQPELLSLQTVSAEALQETKPDNSDWSAQEVLQAIDRLALEQRTVVILALVEGFSCQEIAELQEIPIGTVMSRLSRGRQHLKHQLIELARRESPMRFAVSSIQATAPDSR